MDGERLLEIANFARNVADSMQVRSDYKLERVRELFGQIRGVVGSCMQGLDVRSDLKEFIPTSQLGRLYNSVRYLHDTTVFSSEEVPTLRQHLLLIAEILENSVADDEAGSRRRQDRDREKAGIDIHHVDGDVIISQNQQGGTTSHSVTRSQEKRRVRWWTLLAGFIGFIAAVLGIVQYFGLSPIKSPAIIEEQHRQGSKPRNQDMPKEAVVPVRSSETNTKPDQGKTLRPLKSPPVNGERILPPEKRQTVQPAEQTTQGKLIFSANSSPRLEDGKLLILIPNFIGSVTHLRVDDLFKTYKVIENYPSKRERSIIDILINNGSTVYVQKTKTLEIQISSLQRARLHQNIFTWRME